MGKELLLTISLLTNGKKEELRKCLDSLQPILHNISSELIIVDTGCDHEHRRLIEEYATQIVDFTWCDDFSKARNAGLKKASGKWFLYLDDDEWFEDVTEIVDFFKTGEYRNYHSLEYIQRNYSNSEGTKWTNMKVSRATELIKGIEFTGSIHECFNSYYGPLKIVDTYVHHYGYVYKSNLDRVEHYKRNIDLLKKEYDTNNRNLRICEHLLQEYYTAAQWQEICNIVEEFINDIDEYAHRQPLEINIILCFYAQALGNMYETKKLRDFYDRIQNIQDINIVCRAHMAKVLSDKLFVMHQDEEAFKLCLQYYEYGQEYFNNPNQYLIGLIGEETFQKHSVEDVNTIFLSIGLAQEKYTYLQDMLQWNMSHGFTIKINELIMDLILIRMKDNKNNQVMVELLEMIKNNETQAEFVTKYMEKLKMARNERLDNLLSYSSRILDTEELAICQLLQDPINCFADNFKICIDKNIASFKFCAEWDLFRYKSEKEIASFLIHNISAGQWHIYVNEWCNYDRKENYKTFEDELLIQQSDKWLKSYFLMLIRKRNIMDILSEQKEKFNLTEMEQLIKDFSINSLLYYNLLYSDVVKEEYMDALSQNYQFAVFWQKVLNEREKSNFDYIRILNLIKQEISLYSEWKVLLNWYSKQLNNEYKNTLAKKENNQEFFELALQVRANIIKLYSEGKYDELLPIAKQYLKLVPDDNEINNIVEKEGNNGK